MPKLQWKDLGWKKLKGKIGKLSGLQVQAGLVGSDGEQQHPNAEPGMTVAEIGAIQEFGNGAIPARPFMGPILTEFRSEYMHLCKRLLKKFTFESMTAHEALSEIGRWAVTKMKAKIDSNISPALSPVTVRKKGHNHALIESHVLYESIGFEVVAYFNGKGGGGEDLEVGGLLGAFENAATAALETVGEASSAVAEEAE